MQQPTIGFIGLGRMGQPMATNLLKSGYRLTVFDIVPEKMASLKAAGAAVAGSCQEAAAAGEVAITIVPDSPDVERAVLGEGGAIHGLRRGGILIEMSTIAPGVGRRVASALAARDVAMLDCPVSGGPQGAEAG